MADDYNGAALSLWHQMPKADQQKALREMKRQEREKPLQAPPKKNGAFTLKGYIRCELSASDKEAFKEWETQQDESATMGVLVKVVDSGYLLKVGENGSAYQASLCAASTGREWDGYVLTAHAGTGIRAATLLVFKHEILMQREWTAWMTDESEDALR